MINIKTITCHNVYNYGASLQAYALMDYLEKKGHQVEIIDYMPLYIRKNLSLWAISKKWNKNFFVKILFYSFHNQPFYPIHPFHIILLS